MEENYFWLSFRDDEIDKNLGVTVVPGNDIGEAVESAWKLNLNPGGEVAGIALKPFHVQQLIEKGMEVKKLYTKQEIEELGL